MSLRIKRTNRRSLINLNAPPLHLPTIRVRQPPPPLVLRHRQPQPHQMPSATRPPRLIHRTRRVIFIRRARMKHMRVTQKLDVARRENHVQRVCFARRLEDFHRVLLLV